MRAVLSKQGYLSGYNNRLNRSKDHLLLVKAKAERERLILTNYAEAAAIETELTNENAHLQSAIEAHRSSEPASHLQAGHQGESQHNEKSKNEKSNDEKAPNEKYMNK
jgi:hypothetical protein